MRNRVTALGAAGLYALLVIIGSTPSVSAQKAPSASEAWIRLPAPGETEATAFAIIDNPTMYDVYLVAATSAAASEVRFRDAAATGADKSATVKEVTAPAYSKVELEPGGVHLVLRGLQRPLKAGETIEVIVTTDTGLAFPIAAVVKER